MDSYLVLKHFLLVHLNVLATPQNIKIGKSKT